jgi:hypothetical protein
MTADSSVETDVRLRFESDVAAAAGANRASLNCFEVTLVMINCGLKFAGMEQWHRRVSKDFAGARCCNNGIAA